MKTGNSDSYPKLVSYSDGKLQIDYDVTERIAVEIDGIERIVYDYKYIEIENYPTRGTLIDAFIGNIYTKDAELALINNELTSPGTEAYKEYQTLRNHAKKLADDVLKELEKEVSK